MVTKEVNRVEDSDTGEKDWAHLKVVNSKVVI